MGSTNSYEPAARTCNLKRYEDGLARDVCTAKDSALLSVPRSMQAPMLETSLERR